MCKKICILMAVLGLAFSTDLSARKAKVSIETPASDSRIEYTGRTLVNGDDVSYDWSGVYFRIRFNGPSLKMKCSDTKNCWFNLWTDKEMSPKADKVFMVGAADTLVVLAEGLGKGEHEVGHNQPICRYERCICASLNSLSLCIRGKQTD